MRETQLHQHTHTQDKRRRARTPRAHALSLFASRAGDRCCFRTTDAQTAQTPPRNTGTKGNTHTHTHTHTQKGVDKYPKRRQRALSFTPGLFRFSARKRKIECTSWKDGGMDLGKKRGRKSANEQVNFRNIPLKRKATQIGLSKTHSSLAYATTVRNIMAQSSIGGVKPAETDFIKNQTSKFNESTQSVAPELSVPPLCLRPQNKLRGARRPRNLHSTPPVEEASPFDPTFHSDVSLKTQTLSLSLSLTHTHTHTPGQGHFGLPRLKISGNNRKEYSCIITSPTMAVPKPSQGRHDAEKAWHQHYGASNSAIWLPPFVPPPHLNGTTPECTKLDARISLPPSQRSETTRRTPTSTATRRTLPRTAARAPPSGQQAGESQPGTGRQNTVWEVFGFSRLGETFTTSPPNHTLHHRTTSFTKKYITKKYK